MACNGDCGNCVKQNTAIFAGDLKQFMVESTFSGERMLPTSAVVNLTNQCNNACPYCFVCFQEDFMEYSTAKDTVEFLLKNVIAQKNVEKPTFAFFGGEPLLAFDKIIKPLIIEYGDRINWSITTNGTLLTEEIIDFLADNDVSVLLSWDGLKDV